jgi:hypothetical protein
MLHTKLGLPVGRNETDSMFDILALEVHILHFHRYARYGTLPNPAIITAYGFSIRNTLVSRRVQKTILGESWFLCTHKLRI